MSIVNIGKGIGSGQTVTADEKELLKHLKFNEITNMIEANRPIKNKLNSVVYGDVWKYSSGSGRMLLTDLRDSTVHTDLSQIIKDQSIVGNQDSTGIINPTIPIFSDYISVEPNGAADVSGSVVYIRTATNAFFIYSFRFDVIVEEPIVPTDIVFFTYQLDDANGILMYEQEMTGITKSIGDTLEFVFDQPLVTLPGLTTYSVISKSTTYDGTRTPLSVRRSASQPTNPYYSAGFRVYDEGPVLFSTPFVDGAIYTIGDWHFEVDRYYRCKTTGVQNGTFAANSALWSEVGAVTNVMTYKGGITVAAFNALTLGVAGDFYIITDSGTLTGGVAVSSADFVILNTTISSPISAGEFDLIGIDVSLQFAYEASTDGRLITNATEGALKVRRGSTADTDEVIEVENGAGSSVFNVDGEGKITGTAVVTDNVAIKVKKFVTTSSASNGGSITVAHGLDSSKILTMSATMEMAAGNLIPRDSGISNSEFFMCVDGTDILIDNANSSGADVTSRPVTILITYEA